MKYVLEHIEQQVRDTIISVASRQPADDQKDLVKVVSGECERIKTLLKRQFLAVEDEQIISRCFSFHQASLIRLIDDCVKAASNAPKLNSPIGQVLESLTELLRFLEDRFACYFNLDLKLPDNRKEGVLNELQQTIESIHFRFHQTSLEPSLLQLVITRMMMMKTNWIEFSYRKLYFLRALKDSLVAVESSINDENWLRQNFCRALIKVNFNAEEFFLFYVSHISKCLTACETVSDRIDLVSYFYKMVNQEQCLPNTVFIKGNLPINIQLIEWIAQELEYWKNKQQLHICPALKEDSLQKDFKLNFDLSVSHLAYLFRAFVETGVIQNKNTSALVRFFTNFVRTKKSEAISYDSFRIKFYNAESGTKDAVKKTLQSILQYMNKN